MHKVENDVNIKKDIMFMDYGLMEYYIFSSKSHIIQYMFIFVEEKLDERRKEGSNGLFLFDHVSRMIEV